MYRYNELYTLGSVNVRTAPTTQNAVRSFFVGVEERLETSATGGKVARSAK